ncbi:MAG: hypothetical protein ACTSQQ_11925, partial [Candidatus Helarchaeota archaeon]
LPLPLLLNPLCLIRKHLHPIKKISLSNLFFYYKKVIAIVDNIPEPGRTESLIDDIITALIQSNSIFF